MQHVTNDEILTLRKRIEELEKDKLIIEEQLEMYKATFARAKDAIVIFDEQMNFHIVNAAAELLFEMPSEQLYKKNIYHFLSLVPSHVIKDSYSILQTEGELTDELLIKLENGKEKYIEYSAKRNAFNNYDISIMRDITDRKNLEYERHLSIQLFQDVYERAGVGIAIFDEAGRIIDANPYFCEKLKREKHELLNKLLLDFVSGHAFEDARIMWRSLKLEGTVQGDTAFELPDGSDILFDFSATSNSDNQIFMAIFHDVTENRELVKRLSESEERFRQVFNHALDPIVIWDGEGTVIKANPAAARLFELPLEDLIQTNMVEFVEEDSAKLQAVTNRFLKNNQIRDELHFRMANGQRKLVEFTSNKGVIDGYNMTIYRNVTERKRMVDQLQESEAKFRKIFEAAMDGIILFNDDKQIIDANEVAKSTLHLEKMGGKFFDILYCSDIKFMPVDTHPNSPQDSIKRAHFSFINGMEKTIEFSYKRNVFGDVHLAVFRDVTERLQMEEQLRKSDTLSVVGQLAAGIAHEIRNPMTALKGFIQLMSAEVEDKYDMYFNVMSSELTRIESIITQFLILAKPQAVKYELVDICELVETTLELMRPQAILQDTALKFESEEKLTKVYCEPNQIKQVFINIVKNAIEAMNKGGALTATVKKDEINKVQIIFTDEGPGIPEEKIKKLGEPFYTTKERGTGLGLMVSYKIIEEHDGVIDVYSVLNEGTTFTITLPATLE
ncbi:PAS domain-containing sensor histidine kinase [Bacillus sp. HMF5848]|uniref:PAS domain-containing sensor histidine kinase n=1 Tax=Bacillus sp. HMF5848 TaxID=2495421 RepID=UPI000F7A37D5|nr:PAS domain-containing sensor histidine kinase [Bacillus sp. HMF5848]RSK26711.1 PAS domain-containing sensor histidine kinase [Bacillus sp. HMF5848]